LSLRTVAPSLPTAAADDGRRLQRSLKELVVEHGDFVWRSLKRLGVQGGRADDAVQIVFLAVRTRLADIEPGKERAFLFRVAMNVAAHERRTLARRREELHSDELVAADPGPLPDEALDQARARRLLDRVLDGMPDALRTVFVLHELEEATRVEIAETLEIPPGTVASRIRRAKEAFRAGAARLRAEEAGRADRARFSREVP
jgi:RNA polymerase sigma-70 factor, ECF subfamily